MAKGDYLGEFEHVVLLTILRLGDGAYGAMIRAEIERITSRSPAIGAVHATLERLERKFTMRSFGCLRTRLRFASITYAA